MSIAKTSDRAYIMFGRFNPPTIGHGAIFKKLSDDAKEDGADAFVFVGTAQNSDKNPLTVDQKLYYLEKLYGNLGIHFINTALPFPIGLKGGTCTNPSFAVARLREAGYKILVIYAGSDRVNDFQWIRSSNLKKGLEFPVEIVNRMPPRTENNFVSSMSATKIRQAARNGDLQMVRNGTGLSEENARMLMNQIRNAPDKIVNNRKNPKSRSRTKNNQKDISNKFKRLSIGRRGGTHKTNKNK